MNVAIERRKSFDATDRETISAQNIGFFDVAIDKKECSVKVNDTLSERSRTISDVEIARDKSFDDVSDEKIIDRDDEEDDETEKVENFDSKADETTNC